MSVIEARQDILDALNVGITPTHTDIANFVEEVNDLLIMVNDYDEWDADKETAVDNGDHGLEFVHEPAITVQKLRKMLGYSS
ncbi:hypothetical protein ISF9_050 [Microbacterium phage vB_MoxS-ISF9]|uniref:Uncharacterized protein n=1 Tax=Microbacterium phage vB_MoxS-ISF9 TaxID=1458670 RepID=W8NNL0_9CAUD|nr:hypothetical protein ISF9_050 [Microbacterium phage vB_MoxS-ISF9]AHL18520.1 hypothetical protein ISF9_050 [Microbacterium phage vB_MoxS-ISF9]